MGLDMDGGKTGDEAAAQQRSSGGALTLGLVAGALVAGILGWFALDKMRPLPQDTAGDGANESVPLTALEPDAASQPAPAETSQPEVPTDAAQADAPKPPAFDMFRATPDGSVTVAGQAKPGATVEVLLDGAPVASATAGAGGAFALVFEAPAATDPRALTLRTTDAEGVTTESEQTLVMRPTQSADPVAEGGAVTAQLEPPTSGQAPAPDAQAVTPDGAPDVETMAAPAPVLLADATGARLLDPSTTASPQDPLRIDTIAYDSGAAVTVSGRGGVPGGVVRAYIDNREVGAAPAADDGQWRILLEGVAPGTYTLRVDALDDAGQVSRRAETPFLRETPEALAQAPLRADPAPAGAPAPRAEILTVQPGNTLWAIAHETYGDGFLYVRVFEANRDQIRDPDLIYPGQVFSLPE